MYSQLYMVGYVHDHNDFAPLDHESSELDSNTDFLQSY